MNRKVALFLCLLVSTLGAAQATIPDTPAGRLWQQWLEVYRSGDNAKLTKFIAERFSAKMLDGRPPEAEARREMNVRDRMGNFVVYKAESVTPNDLKLLVHTEDGLTWFNIEWHAEPANPQRMADDDWKPTRAPAEAVGPRRPASELVKEFSTLLDSLAARDRFSGVALVAKDGKVLFEHAYGMADRETKTPNNIDTKFNLGSMPKMFTSVAIAQLVQAGKMKYTDTVAQLLPDYPNQEAAKKIQVSHLLTHTSGLGDYFGPEFDKKKESIKGLKDYLQFFADKPLQFEPGKGWAYSNGGMIVAGLIVERVSGEDYFDYVRNHIFKPAGMNDTDSYPKTEKVPNRATGYTMRFGPPLRSNFDSLPPRGGSAGGGFSTAPDLLRFSEALRGYKLVNRELTELITTAKVDTPMPPERYGYNFMVNEVEGKRVAGHGGGAPGMNSMMDIYWDSGYTVVVLTNLDPPMGQNLVTWFRDRLKQ